MNNGNAVEKMEEWTIEDVKNRGVVHAAVGIKQLALTTEHIQNKLTGELGFASVTGMQCVTRMARRQRVLLTS